MNEIPKEYIFGGKLNIGLLGVCKKAQQDGYKVELWVPDIQKFNQQLLKDRPRLNTLIDTNIAFQVYESGV